MTAPAPESVKLPWQDGGDDDSNEGNESLATDLEDGFDDPEESDEDDDASGDDEDDSD